MQRLHQLPPMILAEELLLMDSCALQKIIPYELVDEGWIGKRKVSSTIDQPDMQYTYAFGSLLAG